MTQLILDAAFPPADVNQWIATLRTAGASGCMAYVWDQQIPANWPPAYCHAILAAGFGILPVYVWGPTYPPVGHARQVMATYGWATGPVMGDIEAGSMPSTGYYASWCDDLRVHGYTPVTYGTPTTLDTYGRYGDHRLAAIYVQRSLNPIYDLTGVSYDGVQYANSFQINGVEVDASVTSIPLIGGGEDVTPDELRQALRDVLDEGTAAGQGNWKGTSIDTAHKVDVLFHQLGEAVAMGQSDAKGTVIDTHDKVDKLYHAVTDPNGAVATLAAVKTTLDAIKASGLGADPGVKTILDLLNRHFK